MTLKEALPHQFDDYFGKAWQYRDVEVVAKYDTCTGGENPHKSWPGIHKNVHVWYLLANGKRVGWNENPARGWSFPVI